MVKFILIKSPDEWATTKQACRDELVVYLFFSPIYTSLYFYVLSTVLRTSSFTLYISLSIYTNSLPLRKTLNVRIILQTVLNFVVVLVLVKTKGKQSKRLNCYRELLTVPVKFLTI